MYAASVKHTRSTNPAPTPISLLQRLSPPQGIIHIGAGTGHGEMHEWLRWNVPYALVIDADRNRLEWAAPLVATRPGWQILSVALAEVNGEIDFYQATNPDEDGVISPERLKALWPNLHTTAQGPRFARRLDHLLAETSNAIFEQAAPVWAVIDCLPALPILRGAGKYIDTWSVLWLRVLLQPTAGHEDDGMLESVDAFLKPHGFRCIDVAESNHPAIGHALFARDWQAILQRRIDTISEANNIITEEKSLLTTRRDALELEVATLSQVKSELSRRAAELETKIETMIQANATLGQEKLVLTELSGSLLQERDNYVNQVDARQKQIDEFAMTITALKAETKKLTGDVEECSRAMQAKDVAAKEKDDHLARLASEFAESERLLKIEIQKLTGDVEECSRAIQAKDVAAKEKDDHLAKLASEFAESERLLKTEIQKLTGDVEECSRAMQAKDVAAKEKEDHFAKLEAESSELVRQQKGISEEMLRAGAQIDLIKDILIQGEIFTKPVTPGEPITPTGTRQKPSTIGRPRKRKP